MARGGYGLEAEAHMVERIDALPAWTAINLNERRKNNPGPTCWPPGQTGAR